VNAVITGSAHVAEPNVKRRRVRLLVTIVLLGTVTSIAFHYILGFYFAEGYPRSTFLFIPGDHFKDWDNLYLYAQDFLKGIPGPFAYFPFAILVVVAATLAPIQVGFGLNIVLFLAALAVMIRGWVVDVYEHLATKVQYAFVLVALSYPVLMVLDRANVEMVIFAIVAGFFYFLYVRKVPWLAALFLGMAIALKLYPATLLVLLLAERRFKLLAL
jgi:hypothetical protein